MKRASERPIAAFGSGFDNPSCGLVPANDAKTILFHDAMELAYVASAECTRIENSIADFRHGSLGFACDFLNELRRVGALWSRLRRSSQGDVAGIHMSAFSFQSGNDRRVESSWDEAVAPCEFQGA